MNAASLLGRLTNAGTPPCSIPLSPKDGIVILSRIYATMIYSACGDAHDAVAKLQAEADLLRLRREIHKQVFGVEL